MRAPRDPLLAPRRFTSPPTSHTQATVEPMLAQIRANRQTDRLNHKAGLLTFPWVGERAFHRGSGGQSPARLSIARAIRALALWKP